MKKIFVFIIICLFAYIIGCATTTLTTNLELVKPASEDASVDWFDTMNANMDLIDAGFDDVLEFDTTPVLRGNLDIATFNIEGVDATEFGYLDGVTSDIQTQLNTITTADVDTSGTPVANDIARFTDVDTIEGLSYAELKAALDLEIGTDLQAYDATLTDIADGTIEENLVNTANPWADNEVSDTLTSSTCTGNAATVTTNANLTGIVTSTGNATAIANKAIAIAKLADGTDGELITWGADGVITTVPVGTATHVLTSNGVGTVPTFQASAGGGYTNLTSFVDQTAWRLFYSNTSGDVTELALGADGTYLKSNGASAAPTFGTGSDKTNWEIPQDYATGTGTSGDPWAGSCIEDAYTACPTGGTIYLRAGYYQMAGALSLAKAINIIGEGMGRTFIVTADAMGFQCDTANITIKNLTIDGAAQTDNVGTNICINSTSGGNFLLIENVEVKNAGYYGLNFNDPLYCIARNVYAHDNYRHGVHSGANGNGTNQHNTYRDIYCYNNGMNGFDARGSYQSAYNTYDNIYSWANTLCGIDIYDEDYSVLINSVSFDNEGNYGGIYIGLCNDFTMSNCLSYANDYDGIILTTQSNTLLSNVISKNNNTSATAGCSALTMRNVSGTTSVKLSQCQLYDDQGTATQKYGVYVESNDTAMRIDILNCKLLPNLTAAISNATSPAAVIQYLVPESISDLADITSTDADYMMIWDATDGLLKKVDMAEVRGGTGSDEASVEAFIFDADAETILGDWDNTANPWADNEVSDTLTSSVCTGNAATVTGFTPASGSLTLAGADALTLTTTGETNATLPLGSNTLYSTLADSISSANLLSSLSDETGTGALVFGTAPTFTSGITATDYIKFDDVNWRTQFGYQAGKYDLAQYNTYIGYQAGSANTSTGKTTNSDYNVGIGYQALYPNNSGAHNIAIGASALKANTEGWYNVAIGSLALQNNTTGMRNFGLGYNTLYNLEDGSYNIAIGPYSLQSGTSGDNNIGVGSSSLKAVLGDGNIGLGFDAGMYETGSNAFYVNNQDRTNTAGDKALSIMYGVMAAAPSNQTLKVNVGDFSINVEANGDPHLYLREGDAAKWDIWNDNADDNLQIESGDTLRYEFGTDGTANADIAWGTFSPIVEGEGKELLVIALEDANKPVKPYVGIPVVKNDDELFDMVKIEFEDEQIITNKETGKPILDEKGNPVKETFINFRMEKIYRERRPNEFATEIEKQSEYEKYHKVPAKIAIANAKYLEYLTGVIDNMQKKIDELEARIEKLEK